ILTEDLSPKGRNVVQLADACLDSMIMKPECTTMVKTNQSSKDTEEEEIESDSEDDHANLADSMVETSKQKKLKFSLVTEGGEQIHLTIEKIKEQNRIEETLKAKLAKQDVEKLKNELINLMGTDVVTQYYNKKYLYDKYCDKVLKRKKSSKITNCDVLTKKGPITMKIYREDGTNEIISNFKVSDLYLAEWKEVVQACPNKKEKRRKTIYELINTRINYLNQTEKELRINFNKPLKEQDPLDELNDLANKKIKRAGDFKDHSRLTKKHKSLVQHEDEVH
ncbi:hypothetical protein Tco_0717171, partial [Tanacetum coccineum]